MRWTPAVLYSPDGPAQSRIRCDACPMRCLLDDGEVGRCHVRRRTGRVMETATFATSVRNIDAIERKPFYHYKPGSRAITLAAPGCTFRCDYCVNHTISQYGREPGRIWSASPVDPAEVVAAAAEAGACVALSYTEPSLAPELTLALAEHGSAAGVDVVWKSNGFLTPEAVTLVAPALAAVNLDIKAADEHSHHRLTGAPLRPVLDTFHAFAALGVWMEVSTPLIPGVSDHPSQLKTIARLIAAVDREIPWHLLRFTPTFRLASASPTSPHALARAVDIGREAGLRYVYVERALGEAGRSTRCPGCGQLVVRRGIWETTAVSITAGGCGHCGVPLAGRWR
ncbi:AmmeMemoRadiSam system radical SAM enzyme [Streptosporangiaceae bacterium NEAU-GS5]|nr:AmmeMemoRadiSam system radical SAM enzyme [Streptosporangiaceae bacterium NEAU-GS5]